MKLILLCVKSNGFWYNFEIYASRFINFCTNASNLQKDEFFESSHNLNLMAKILLKN